MEEGSTFFLPKKSIYRIKAVKSLHLDAVEKLGHPLTLREHTRSFSDGGARNEIGHDSSLPPLALLMKSWVLAAELLNHDAVKRFYFGQTGTDNMKHPFHEKSKRHKNVKSSNFFPELDIPQQAPRILWNRHQKFQQMLHASRENFEQAANRSLKAVSNTGGWLKIRPITALYLQASGYKGMYVKIRYGSETISSCTVPAAVNPEWNTGFEGIEESIDDEYRNSREKTENIVLGSLLGDESFYFARDSDESNDLSVQVQPLRTGGSIRLEVIGVKFNTKEVLGVLDISLASAISCCTELYDEDRKDSNLYVRWFPLTDPRWANSLEGNIDHSNEASTTTEHVSSGIFAQHYTKCIKLAMWWKPMDPDNHYASPSNDTREDRNTYRALNTMSYFHANLNSVSASIIDSFRARELISLAVTDIDVRNSVTKPKTWLSLVLGKIQIDHHDENGMEPVILSPTPVLHPQPTLQFLAVKNNVKSKSNIDSFQHIALNLVEMDLRIEELWMFDLWEMYFRILKRHKAMQKSIQRSKAVRCANENIDETLGVSKGFKYETISDISNEIKDAFEEAQLKKDKAADDTTKKIYIDELMLGLVRLNISYIKSRKRGVEDMVTEIFNTGSSQTISRSEIMRRWSELGHVEDRTTSTAGRSRSLPDLISSIFPAISGARIRISGKALNNVFESWSELISTLTNFYRKEMVYQFYKIIGSLDIVGNPSMAINSVIKGARDFVVIPLREFLRSPKDPSRLALGIAKGYLSFNTHFFSGVFGFISNLCEAAGSGFTALSFDDYFKRWHAEQVSENARRRHLHEQFRPNGKDLVAQAVMTPILDLCVGVIFATSGIITEPYIGAKNQGVAGFAKGIAVGTMGLVTKPIVGFFDACAHFNGSISDFASFIHFDKKLTPVKKLRCPYIFGTSSILLSYNATDSQSATLLRTFPLDAQTVFGKRNVEALDEVVVTSEVLLLNPGEATYIVVSTRRIVRFEVKINSGSQPTRIWQIDIDNDVKIVSNLENFCHSGYMLRIFRVPLKDSTTSSTTTFRNVNSNQIDKVGGGPNVGDSAFSDTKEQLSNDATRDDNNLKAIIHEHALSLIPQSTLSGRGGFNRNPPNVEVLGEFSHNKELTRIHNAICCVTKQFERIIYGGKIETEGRTSFGNMYFVDKDLSHQRSILGGPEDALFKYLEDVPWVHFKELRNDESQDVTVLRQNWCYADELEVSKKLGGPKWAIESRARSFFIPMPFPRLPSSLSVKDYPELDSLKDKLESGVVSFEVVDKAVKAFIELSENNRFVSAREFSSTQTEPDTKECLSIKSAPDNDRFFSIYDTDYEARSSLFADDPNDEGSLKDGNKDNIEQRLENLEDMLEALLQQVNTQSPVQNSTFQSICETSVIRAPLLKSSGTSMISGLSSADNGVGDTASTMQNQNAANEKKELLSQIEELKRQLADAQRNPPHVRTWYDSESHSTSMKSDRGEKKRKRKLAKPWR